MPARTGRPWQRLKARVIRRDGGICHICGQPEADSADHLVPYSRGGRNTMDNLRAVHHNVEPYCNRRRGAGTITAARTAITNNQPQGWTW